MEKTKGGQVPVVWTIADPTQMPAILQSADEVAACWLKAQRGEKDAQFQIGYLLFSARGQHLGIKKNHRRAQRWLQKAALQGHAEAQFYLGLMYHYGLGVHANRVRYRRWLEKAARQGHNEARTWLASALTCKRKTLKWLWLAAEDGHVSAMNKLATTRRLGLSRAERFHWLKEGTRQGGNMELLIYGRTDITLDEFPDL